MSALPAVKKIGITGSMGSGKSQACRILARNYPVIDCDAVNARLLEKGQPGYQALMEKPYIRLINSQIDKACLAGKMFANSQIKQEVEGILHPLIFERINEWVKVQTSPFVFIEMPLLFETGSQDFFDAIWCVTCSEKTALERLQKYRGIDEESARMRLASQFDTETKKAGSSFIIYNDGSLQELEDPLEKGVLTIDGQKERTGRDPL